MQKTNQPTAPDFWAKEHPVKTRQQRISLFTELVDTLTKLIEEQFLNSDGKAKAEQTAHPTNSVADMISYYDDHNEHQLAFRLSEDYLSFKKSDSKVLMMYIKQLVKLREPHNPEARVRKLQQAMDNLLKARIKKSDIHTRDRLLLDLMFCMAVHMPNRTDKEKKLSEAIRKADEFNSQHKTKHSIFMWKKATYLSELGALQRQIGDKVKYYLQSMQTLCLIKDALEIQSFTNILLVNYEELLSIAQTNDECKEMIEIIEKNFTSFITKNKSVKPPILHNLAWLYYKKANTTNFDAEREFYLNKSEFFLNQKDKVFKTQKREPKASHNLRAHIASVRAEHEQVEINKFHYLYDSIDLYRMALKEAPEETAIHSYIAGAYLKLAEEENDTFKRMNLIAESIQHALIASRVGIDVSYAYIVLAKAYHMLEDLHSDKRQKEIYFNKRIQYEELLH